LHEIIQEEHPEILLPSIPLQQMVEKYKQNKENEKFEKQSKLFEYFFTCISKNFSDNKNVEHFLKEKDLKKIIQNSQKNKGFLSNVKKYFSVNNSLKNRVM
jgi:hypothetical protein